MFWFSFLFHFVGGGLVLFFVYLFLINIWLLKQTFMSSSSHWEKLNHEHADNICFTPASQSQLSSAVQGTGNVLLLLTEHWTEEKLSHTPRCPGTLTKSQTEGPFPLLFTQINQFLTPSFRNPLSHLLHTHLHVDCSPQAPSNSRKKEKCWVFNFHYPH